MENFKEIGKIYRVIHNMRIFDPSKKVLFQFFLSGQYNPLLSLLPLFLSCILFVTYRKCSLLLKQRENFPIFTKMAKHFFKWRNSSPKYSFCFLVVPRRDKSSFFVSNHKGWTRKEDKYFLAYCIYLSQSMTTTVGRKCSCSFTKYNCVDCFRHFLVYFDLFWAWNW